MEHPSSRQSPNTADKSKGKTKRRTVKEETVVTIEEVDGKPKKKVKEQFYY